MVDCFVILVKVLSANFFPLLNLFVKFESKKLLLLHHLPLLYLSIYIFNELIILKKYSSYYSKMSGVLKKIVQSANAPAAIGPYSQAVRAGQTLYISGQLGLVPATGDFKSAAGGEPPIRAQTEQALQNIGEILKAAGGSFDNVVKTTILLVDMAHFPVVNEVYAKFFNEKQGFPARACYQVSALPKGGLVEIESIAVLP